MPLNPAIPGVGVYLSQPGECIDGTFGIALNSERINDVPFTKYTHPNYRKDIYLADGSDDQLHPLVFSSTVFRVSSKAEGEDLVMPSNWETLPCVPTIVHTGESLFFCYNPGSIHSGMVGAVTIDATKGNGLEGSFPAIYDSGVCCAVRSFGGEKIHVLGTLSNPAETVTMQVYVPQPPISTDSVSGGPVVTDLFAYSSEEIRGSVEGLLAARENLPVGSVGWLDGKRYRVHLPGRMLQIG